VSAPRDEGEIPRRRERLSLLRGAASATHESWNGANDAMKEKLQRHSLERRARAQGLQLRHSEYGYALVDAARKRVDDRGDMTLEEVESCLSRI
jgi:hypothetical protein